MPSYCGECGAEAKGGRFCVACGAALQHDDPSEGGVAAVDDAEPGVVEQADARDERPTQQLRPVRSLQPKAPPRPAGIPRGNAALPSQKGTAATGRTKAIIAVSVAMVVLVGSALAAVLIAKGGGKSYASEVRDAVNPVTRANRELGDALDSLQGKGGSEHALGEAQRAVSAARGAQATMRVLEPSSSEETFSVATRQALARELVYLEAMEAALEKPTKAAPAGLAGAEPEAKAQLEAVEGQLPSFAASLPADKTLLAYLENQAQTAGTTSSLRAFGGQVRSLLEQSAPSFQTINQVFGQMQTVAQGGTSTMNLAEVESAISEVIANRDALAASARSLDTPTHLAGEVRSALGASLSASLIDDQDIEQCLNEANTGGLAFIFEGCLNASASDNDAATAAKEHFFQLYNKLRASVGESSVHSQF